MSELTATIETLKSLAAQRAASDEAFMKDLLANPRAAVEKAFEMELPANVKIQAVEEPADTYVVVVPRAAKVAADGELSDNDLEAVAGGYAKMRPGMGAPFQIGSAKAPMFQGGSLGGQPVTPAIISQLCR